MVRSQPAVDHFVDLDDAIRKPEANGRFLATIVGVALDRQFEPAIIHGSVL